MNSPNPAGKPFEAKRHLQRVRFLKKKQGSPKASLSASNQSLSWPAALPIMPGSRPDIGLRNWPESLCQLK